MHIVISWDISANTQRWEEINKKLKEGLSGYSWARPLSTFYVVKIASEVDRGIIRGRLIEIAKSVTETVHIVISPMMSGGQYDGFLPKDMWAKLNERSNLW